MTLTKWIGGIAVVLLLAGCSGGGANNPDESGAVVPAIKLAKSNVSDIAEILHGDLRYAVDFHESMRSFYGSVPQFNYQNANDTYDCDISGSYRVVVRSNGADIEEEFNQCSDYSGVVVNGRLGYKYENVSAASNSYTLTLTTTGYRATLNNSAVFATDGSVRMNVVLQQTNILLTVQSRRVLQSPELPENVSTNATYSLSYPIAGYQNSTDIPVNLTNTSGNIDLSTSGTVSLSWDNDRRASVLQGAGAERGYIELTTARFVLDYVASDGVTSSIGVSADSQFAIDAFSKVNSQPILMAGTKKAVTRGSAGSLALENWLFDTEFDVLDVVVSVVSAPANANYQIGALKGFAVPFSAQTLGDYSLKIQATDPSGLKVEGSITIEVVADSDNDGIADVNDLDDDNDGVEDAADAFPLDQAESLDTDRDGVGNNADTDDDNDGVSDAGDSFPLNFMCQSAPHGENGVCRSVSVGAAQETAVDVSGVIYFLDAANKKVVRWSTATNQFLASITLVGATPSDSHVQHMTYSAAHGRLYVGYDTGSITYIDLSQSSLLERGYVTLPLAVGGMTAVGNYLLAQDASGAWATHYIVNKAGVITDQKEWNYYSRAYAWDAAANRVYFFRDDTSPNDLHYEVIDQASGKITANGETPYHGAYAIEPPIVVADDGLHVMLGTGAIYNTAGLTWAGSIPGGFGAGLWTISDGLITARSNAINTTIERRSATLVIKESVQLPGELKWLLRTINGYKLITVVDGDVRIVTYTPSDDSDGDGVNNLQDDFPLDKAASLDTDHDGYPDSWNAGRSQADSTTGLTLDAYPNDSACRRAEDGDGTTCDYDRVIPLFTPDRIVSDGAGVIYLLSREHYRVYRWSVITGSYLAPLVVGSEHALDAFSPKRMEYSPAHDRLYFGYDEGNVTYIDLSHPNGIESSFVTIAESVGGIGIAGDKVLLQDGSGAWETHYIYSRNGQLLDSAEWNHYSSAYAWNPALNRIYYFRDGTSPNDLLYEQLDPASGEILSTGETPYHGSYQIEPPILISPAGDSVLLGSGDVYVASSLTWKKSLPSRFLFGAWLSTGKIVTLRANGAASRVDVYDTNQNWSSEANIVGAPRGVFEVNGKAYVVTEQSSELVYTEFSVP